MALVNRGKELVRGGLVHHVKALRHGRRLKIHYYHYHYHYHHHYYYCYYYQENKGRRSAPTAQNKKNEKLLTFSFGFALKSVRCITVKDSLVVTSRWAARTTPALSQ